MNADRDGDLPLFRWRPPPRVLVFPPERRRDLVERNARRMIEFHPSKAEAHLQRLLASVGERLLRLGCEVEQVRQHLARLECAVRAHYARLRAIDSSGGAA
ncbi:DUF6074 family protein [Ancylobacter tetraedralis]|uniref:DUF6074 family protein n=1 Tax=Ancylobacter tetraedralis TaxID=217068 RepID=UPI003CCDEB65